MQYLRCKFSCSLHDRCTRSVRIDSCWLAGCVGRVAEESSSFFKAWANHMRFASPVYLDELPLGYEGRRDTDVMVPPPHLDIRCAILARAKKGSKGETMILHSHQESSQETIRPPSSNGGDRGRGRVKAALR
jgi:hypothetical protein